MVNTNPDAKIDGGSCLRRQAAWRTIDGGVVSEDALVHAGDTVSSPEASYGRDCTF